MVCSVTNVAMKSTDLNIDVAVTELLAKAESTSQKRALAEAAGYYEDGPTFDPQGDYLCGGCSFRLEPNKCAIVKGDISMTNGGCIIYRHGPQVYTEQIPHVFDQDQVIYTERTPPGFGCKRCEYMDDGNCKVWDIEVQPNACCYANEGPNDITAYGTSEGVKKAWETRGLTDMNPQLFHAKTVNTSDIVGYEKYQHKDIVEKYRKDIRSGKSIPAIRVTPIGDGKYFIADGHHRWKAAQKEGLKTMDVVVEHWEGPLEAAAYKLDGRTEFRGLGISIETDKGKTRTGVADDGKPWSVTMTHPYGYIRGTEGVDGDHVDCFLGDNENAENVYVVHALDRRTGKYDEDKCMLGFDSGEEAKKAFLSNYSTPGFFGSMDEVPFEKFKEKVLATKDDPKMIEAKAIFHGVPLEGFTTDEEEMIRAMMSRVPEELLTNVSRVLSDKSLQPKHGKYEPTTKSVHINPLIFSLRQRFGEGQGWVSHPELTVVHEIGHSIYFWMPEQEKDLWRDLSGWMVGWKEGQAPNYQEKRPGWPHNKSKWSHRKGVRFTRHYAERNDDEDFADCFAFLMLNKPHQMAVQKREFVENLIRQRVKKYPQVLIEGPSKPYGERDLKYKYDGITGAEEVKAYGTSEGVKKEWDERGRGKNEEDKEAEIWALKEAVDDWIRDSRPISKIADDIIQSGKPPDPLGAAGSLLLGIKESDPTKVPIYRGVEAANKEEEKRIDQLLALKPGDEFQLGPRSFSKNQETAQGFLMRAHGRGVMLKVDEGANGIDVNQVSFERAKIYAENEVITDGRFKVLDVATIPRTIPPPVFDVNDKGETQIKNPPDTFTMIHVKQLGVL